MILAFLLSGEKKKIVLFPETGRVKSFSKVTRP